MYVGFAVTDLADLARPDANRALTTPDVALFARTYPFLPYHFELMQDAFANLRAKGGRSTQLTGGERSMLGVTQAVLASASTGFAGDSPGRLVRLDEIYDQIVSEVPSQDRRAISKVAESPLPSPSGNPKGGQTTLWAGSGSGGAIHPAQALKALFILQHVIWLPPHLDNLTKLLVGHMAADLTQARSQVKAALDELLEQRYISVADGQYKYLSAAERNIEEEIAAEPVKNNDIRREVRTILGKLLSDVGQLNYKNGTATFDIRVRGDDEEIRGKGDLTLEVYSPLAIEFETVDPATVRDVQSTVEDRTVYWLPSEVTSLMPDFRRLIRVQEVVKRREVKSDQSMEEALTLRDKHKELDLLRGRLQTAINRALFTGRMIYAGEETALDGKMSTLNPIFNRELAKVIPHVYTKFYLAEVKVNERSLQDMLMVRPGNLAHVEPDLKLWEADTGSAQPRFNEHSPAVSELLGELDRQAKYGHSSDGKTLLEHFRAVPYGWNPILVRILLAALFRAAKITLEYEGKRYTDPSARVAQEALTKSANFNRTVFRYDPQGGLTPDERRQARQYLNILFDRQVDDTTPTLARTLQEELATLAAQHKDIVHAGEKSGLPVKDLLYQGGALLEKILCEPDPDGQVRAVLQAYDTLSDLLKYQTRLAGFIKAGHLPLYQRSVALLTAVDRARPLVAALTEAPITARLEDMRHLAAEREVVEKWAGYYLCYQAVLQAYQGAYTDLYQRRAAAYRQARDEVIQFTPDIPDSITRFINEAKPGYWDETGLRYPGETADLTDLHYQIQGADKVKEAAIEAIQKLEVSQKKDDETVIAQPKPVYLKAIQVVPSAKIETRAQLTEALKALEDRIGPELDAGRTVILG